MTCIRRKNSIVCEKAADGEVLHSATPHQHIHEHDPQNDHGHGRVGDIENTQKECDSIGSKVEILYSDEESEGDQISKSMLALKQ